MNGIGNIKISQNKVDWDLGNTYGFTKIEINQIEMNTEKNAL